MQEKIRGKINDCSTDRAFVFAVQCEACGRVYKTMPVAFDPLLEIKDEAREAAFKQALKDFSGTMNQCQECERIVCDKCFQVNVEQDLCADCSTRLNYKGKPVANG
jgi:rRNA maturation endonuclease Nob1